MFGDKRDQKVGRNGDLFTVEEWKRNVSHGYFNEFDGSGSFVSNGKYVTGRLFDDVFGEIPEGVTHIEWYNK